MATEIEVVTKKTINWVSDNNENTRITGQAIVNGTNLETIRIDHRIIVDSSTIPMKASVKELLVTNDNQLLFELRNMLVTLFDECPELIPVVEPEIVEPNPIQGE